jgi:hypothetical protein
VFVSGSAASYQPLSETVAIAFLTELGRALVRRGMNVVTGFGLGVGPHVINGVLDELENQGTRNLSDRLVMRPFPYAIADPQSRQRRWRRYREDILAEAGAAVFVFGNKKDDRGGIVEADGVPEEFEIAKSRGLVLVPVGCTGWVAKRLYQRLEQDLGAQFPRIRGLRSAFRSLNSGGTPSEIADRVVAFIELASGQ